MLSLLAAVALGSEGRSTIVTFDNGEFNAPLYAPRWNGRWRRPSLAQELATTVARVLGDNPRVFTYMPAGRTEGLPGQVHEVAPVRPGCTGAAETPGDDCWCSPADNCWGGLQANYHPAGSTSLVRTASGVRAAVAEKGPRLEVHFTDFFEEDPAAADDPADSDKCVTADGVRRAVAGVLSLGEGESLDHLSVGVLHATIDPPPPGGSYGWIYRFEPAKEGAGCWSGTKGRAWSPGADPLSMAMGVVVLGVNTSEKHESVRSWITGLADQLSGESSQLKLVHLIEPQPTRTIHTVITAVDASPFRVGVSKRASSLPCEQVTATAELATSEGRLQLADVQARCDGQAGVTFGANELRRHFVRASGLDPSFNTLDVSGTIELRSQPEAMATALASLHPPSIERDLPLWSAAAAALDPMQTPEGQVQPWSERITIERVSISDIDGRPWLLAVMASAVVALLGGLASISGLRQLHAARAMRSHYESSSDPLQQRPLSLVIAEAQQEVARGWAARNILGASVAIVLLALTFVSVMLVYRVMLG